MYVGLDALSEPRSHSAWKEVMLRPVLLLSLARPAYSKEGVGRGRGGGHSRETRM